MNSGTIPRCDCTASSWNTFSESENTYLLHAAVLLEKLTGSAASQEIPHIFGTRRFITLLTSARHLSPILSQLHPVLTTPSHFLKIRLNH